MAFVCPKQEETDKKRANLTAIADVVNELIKEYDNVYCEPVTVPTCCCCPGAPQENIGEPPNVMVCYKVGKVKGSTNKSKKSTKNSNNNANTSIPLKQSKSRELRGSVMYVGCDCCKRNGLQDDCRRTECHGSPECLTQPEPTCGPSQFSNGKHLGKPYPHIGHGGGRTVSGGSHNARADVGVVVGDANDVLDYEYQCYPASVVNHEKVDEMGPTCLCNCVCDENGNYYVDTGMNTECFCENELVSYCCSGCCEEPEEPEEDEWEYAIYPARLTELYPNDCDGKWPCRCKQCWRALPFNCPVPLSFPCPFN